MHPFNTLMSGSLLVILFLRCDPSASALSAYCQTSSIVKNSVCRFVGQGRSTFRFYHRRNIHRTHRPNCRCRCNRRSRIFCRPLFSGPLADGFGYISIPFYFMRLCRLPGCVHAWTANGFPGALPLKAMVLLWSQCMIPRVSPVRSWPSWPNSGQFTANRPKPMRRSSVANGCRTGDPGKCPATSPCPPPWKTSWTGPILGYESRTTSHKQRIKADKRWLPGTQAVCIHPLSSAVHDGYWKL